MQSSSRFAAATILVVALLGGGVIWYAGQSTNPALPRPTDLAVPSFASAPTASPAPPTIEGTWNVWFTRPDVLAAGIADEAEDSPDTYGHFHLTFQSGRWSMEQLSPELTSVFPGTTSTYTVDGRIAHLFSSEDDVTFDIPYTLSATTLTFRAGGPVTFRVKPWTRVATEVIALGWPNRVPSGNAPGLYSWDGPDHRHCAGGWACNYGFMYRGGGVAISIRGLPHEDAPVLKGASGVRTVAGYRGLYQRWVDDPVREEWIVDIDGVVVAISLTAEPGFSEAALADAHAIIDSLRYESIGQASFRLTFRLTNGDWDSGYPRCC